MTPGDLEHQADQFLAWYAKHPRRASATQALYAEWARSKGLSSEAQVAIWREVRERPEVGLGPGWEGIRPAV